MYRKYWLNFVGLNLFLDWIFCSLVPAGSIQWFIEDHAFLPSDNLAPPPPPPLPSRQIVVSLSQSSFVSPVDRSWGSGWGGGGGKSYSLGDTFLTAKNKTKNVFVYNLSWSLLRIENRRGEWRRRDPRTKASERIVASRNKEKILLKGQTGQIWSDWEWYEWIGHSKNIPRYGFLIF